MRYSKIVDLDMYRFERNGEKSRTIIPDLKRFDLEGVAVRCLFISAKTPSGSKAERTVRRGELRAANIGKRRRNLP